MRTTTTPIFIIVMTGLLAQAPGGDMFFDGADDLHLDSIYPAGCWQVGQPNKPVFTSAFSEPNALVTDTLQPHADSTTCYAQFTMVADVPDVLGKSITFNYWCDMDTLVSLGWLERQDPGTFEWHRMPLVWDFYEEVGGAEVLWTDSGSFFTGRTFGWQSAYVNIWCMGVLWDPDQERGGWGWDTMRLRFAFRGAANTNGRDGWMIDNLTVIPEQCSGGFADRETAGISVFPNPADDHLTISLAAPGSGSDWEILRADGAVVRRNATALATMLTIDTRDLPTGLYALRVQQGGKPEIRPFVVQH